MKVAIPSEGPDLGARVGDRLGLSPYLLIVDLESKEVETIQSPRDSGSGAGMELVALIIEKKSDVLLTRWCGPVAERVLSNYNVEVVEGISGTVGAVLAEFERGITAPPAWKIDRRVAAEAVRRAFHQIKNLLPVLIGVVFLVGLINVFLSEDLLAAVFSGGMGLASLRGAVAGSVFTGNPVNSYVIGGELLKMGASLAAVTAFICAWVTVGLFQLPAEIAALGWKFAVVRNISCFGLSLAVSFVMVCILNLLGV